jgi:NAD(P)H-dependent FMN reductase
MKVLAFAASNAPPSINQQLAVWAERQVPNAVVTTLSLKPGSAYEPDFSGACDG